MSCEFNFQTPTVGKMEAVTVSVGWDAVLEKKKREGGGRERQGQNMSVLKNGKALLRSEWTETQMPSKPKWGELPAATSQG